ncbi:tyrosine-protein phosphatase [Schumannella sp. 10F1B-5-1]|uniref:tyrosine-protein phosphatase n=1 Tax=Schumannella sp. 10F1B-5-1 TaxID=2590780 RepID=UPI0015E8577B|nr:tyrosine-protein phosphatase [Schumannella sp. 10F1B-5-1]
MSAEPSSEPSAAPSNPPSTPRDVAWEGLANGRDLGGLPLGDGAEAARGRVFRSGRPDGLTAAGWDALAAAGVRRIVDLRSDWERTELPGVPASVEIAHRPIEDVDDEEFMAEWRAHLGGPAYYLAAMRRWPDRLVAALTAIADAPADGGVLVHCSAGRDRTGMIVALLLREAGAGVDAIADDYAAAARGIRAHFATMPDAPERPVEDAVFERALAENLAALQVFLTEVDTAEGLRAGGADPGLLSRAAARLRG